MARGFGGTLTPRSSWLVILLLLNSVPVQARAKAPVHDQIQDPGAVQNKTHNKAQIKVQAAQKQDLDRGAKSSSPVVKHIPLVLRVDFPRPGEKAELQKFIAPYISLQMTEPALRHLEKAVLGIGRYRAVRCAYKKNKLLCSLSSARTLRRLVLEDLPPSILKSEFKKRVFMRAGQRLDTGGMRPRDRFARQKDRLESYLERQGVFGSKVLLRALPLPGDPRQVDLLVRVQGGHLASLRQIEVEMAPESTQTPLDEEGLRSLFRPWPWQNFKPETFRAQLEAQEQQIRASGEYPEARLSGQFHAIPELRAVDINLRLRWGPHVQHRFVGAKNNREIKWLTKSIRFSRSGSVDELELQASQEAMRAELQARGYFSATVHAQMQVKNSREVEVLWTIHHGPRAYIGEIIVQTFPALQDPDWRKGLRLLTHARRPTRAADLYLAALPWTPRLVQRWFDWDRLGSLQDQALQADKRSLEQALVQAGYAEGSVQTQVSLRPQGDLRIVFRVTPGPRFILADVQCTGLKALSCVEIRKVLRHKRGGPFQPDLLDVDKSRILNLYASRGFPHAHVELLSDFVPAGAVLRVQVAEGPQAMLSSILVDGNVQTQRDVILRELAAKAGQKLEPQKLDLGLRRLRRTGIFRHVRGRYLGLDADSQAAAYAIQLEERRNLSLDTSLHFSTAELLGLSAELRDRNVAGRMIDLNLGGRFGLYVGRHSKLFAQLSWPRIWGSRASLSARAHYDLNARPNERTDFMSNLRLDPELSLQQTQTLRSRMQLDFALRAGLRLTSAYELSLDWWRLAQVKDLENFAFKDSVRTGALSTGIEWRQLDNPFDPRRGYQLSSSVKWGARAMGGDGDFAVVNLSTQYYFSFSRVTLASSVRGTAAALFDIQEGMQAKNYIPERDLLIAGGDRSVRGHEEGSIGVLTTGPDGSLLLKPGLLGLVANSEARLRLMPFWIGELQLAAFIDLAWVGDEISLNPDPHKQSFGVGIGSGLRYVTPVGPIVFDLAVDPAHPTQPRLHMMFGYSF